MGAASFVAVIVGFHNHMMPGFMVSKECGILELRRLETITARTSIAGKDSAVDFRRSGQRLRMLFPPPIFPPVNAEAALVALAGGRVNGRRLAVQQQPFRTYESHAEPYFERRPRRSCISPPID